MTPSRFWYIVGYTFRWCLVVLVIYGITGVIWALLTR